MHLQGNRRYARATPRTAGAQRSLTIILESYSESTSLPQEQQSSPTCRRPFPSGHKSFAHAVLEQSAFCAHGVPSGSASVSSVASTVTSSVGGVVGRAVGDAEGDAVGCSVGPFVGSSVGPAVGSSVGFPVGDLVGLAVGATDKTVGFAPGAGISQWCLEPLMSTTCTTLSAGPHVGSGVGGSVGTAVGSSVGFCVGVFVGSAVGSAVGLAVGLGVGDLVGARVGEGVGLGVGRRVGLGVGLCFGAYVGFAVGANVTGPSWATVGMDTLIVLVATSPMPSMFAIALPNSRLKPLEVMTL